MEIKVIELRDDLARIAFIGEGHTFMNALVDEILRDPEVDVANYSSEFHFTDPVLLVTTKGGKKPVDAIREAAVAISGNCSGLIETIEKS
ncbi:MAG: DNA-directed RNA polymerase subunit L [Methanomicrobiaceae archaeon]|nr:DNA-directed RNA polymerase subunit L [Methanomicrobiaceae archaeon]